MNDLVARLRAQPTERTYDSVGRAYDFPQHLIEEAASRISQQDAELERLRREVEEARQVAEDRLSDNARLTNEKADALFGLAEARKAAFIEVAEMASLSSSPSVYAFAAMIRSKAEETGR